MGSVSLSGPVAPETLREEVDSTTLKGKSILITGAARGLGAELAKACAKAGAHVTVADVLDEQGKELCSQLSAQGQKAGFVHCDVTVWKDQVEAFKAAIRSSPSGRLDHVIPNAGVMDAPFFTGADQPIRDLDYDPPEPDAAPIEVNLRGVMYTLKLAQLYLTMETPTPAEPGSSSILFVLSPESYITLPCSIIYGGAKFGARGLFRSARLPLACKGVRVNALVPWLMETPMNAGNGGLGEVLSGIGIRYEGLDKHVRASMHMLSRPDIVGRVIAVQQGDWMVRDIEDDEEGRDAAKYRDYGYEGLPTGKEAIAKLYGLLGFDIGQNNAMN